MNIKIKVPVKPHIRQYLITQFGNEIIAINSNNPCIISAKLYDLLTRPDRSTEYDMHSFSRAQEYTSHIYFEINSKTQRLAGFDLTDEKIYSFNHFIDLIIRERLFILLDALQMNLLVNTTGYKRKFKCPRVKLKSVINQYIDLNDLSESGITYETLKKAYYRYRVSARRPGAPQMPWHIPTDHLVPKKPKRAA